MDPMWRGLRPNKAVLIFKKHSDISTKEFSKIQLLYYIELATQAQINELLRGS